MPIHVRVLVNSVSPLDGATPIDFATAVITQDAVTGETVVNLPTQDFGVFDPGSAAMPGQTKKLHLTHISVQSKGGVYSAGDVVRMSGPRGGALASPVLSARPVRTIVALEDAGAVGLVLNASGLLSEGLCLPIPMDHLLEFDTTTGAQAGPHTVFMSFSPVPKLETVCQQLVL